MSKKKQNLKLTLDENKKSYFNLLNATDYFKKMMKRYTYHTQKTKKYLDIYTLLKDYRNQKIRQISDNDMLREDIGEEIKKLQEFKPNIGTRRLSIKEKNEMNKNKNKIKKRENRLSFLVNIEKKLKGKKINKNLYKEYIEPELNPNKIIYHKRYFSLPKSKIETKKNFIVNKYNKINF